MISNVTIQSAWIAKLKANTSLTALVSAAEVREDQWKGTDFIYPNVRVKLTSLSPTVPFNNCLIFKSDVTILCYSEQKSSKLADQIAGVVTESYWGHPFSSSGVKFTAINWTSTTPAYTPENDTNAWVSEVHFSCLVQAG